MPTLLFGIYPLITMRLALMRTLVEEIISKFELKTSYELFARVFNDR
jgi:hypothetical protein